MVFWYKLKHMSRKRKRLPKGIRKYIRCQKACLRREFLDLAERQEKINQLYQLFQKKVAVIKPLAKNKKK